VKHAALALLLVLAGGCKKKGGSSDLGREFRDAVCACKDIACIEKVGQDMAARAGDRATPNFDTDAVQAATKCMEKLYAAQAAAPPPGLPAVPPKVDADSLIAAARAAHTDPRMTISNITVEYVDAKGMLDDEYGGVWVSYGVSNKPADDPKRKTGAPVKADAALPETCPTVTYAKKWTVGYNACPQEEPHVPRCTVAQIWKRAIAKEAPGDALAVVKYRNLVPPLWFFTIHDAPRDVNIALELPDDCERELEKP
jgi:hypothetical protein